MAYLNTRHQQNAQEERTSGVASLLREWGGLIKLDTGDTRTRYAGMRPEGPQTCCTISEYAGPAPRTDAPRGPPRIHSTRTSCDSQGTSKLLVSSTNGGLAQGMRNNMVSYLTLITLGNLEPRHRRRDGAADPVGHHATRRHRDTSTKIARLRYSNMSLTFSRYLDVSSYYFSSRCSVGHRIRDGFPFDTRNMDLSHVALWLHDHGLSLTLSSCGKLNVGVAIRAISDHRSEDGNGHRSRVISKTWRRGCLSSSTQ